MYEVADSPRLCGEESTPVGWLHASVRQGVHGLTMVCLVPSTLPCFHAQHRTDGHLLQKQGIEYLDHVRGPRLAFENRHMGNHLSVDLEMLNLSKSALYWVYLRTIKSLASGGHYPKAMYRGRLIFALPHPPRVTSPFSPPTS